MKKSQLYDWQQKVEWEIRSTQREINKLERKIRETTNALDTYEFDEETYYDFEQLYLQYKAALEIIEKYNIKIHETDKQFYNAVKNIKTYTYELGLQLEGRRKAVNYIESNFKWAHIIEDFHLTTTFGKVYADLVLISQCGVFYVTIIHSGDNGIINKDGILKVNQKTINLRKFFKERFDADYKIDWEEMGVNPETAEKIFTHDITLWTSEDKNVINHDCGIGIKYLDELNDIINNVHRTHIKNLMTDEEVEQVYQIFLAHNEQKRYQLAVYDLFKEDLYRYAMRQHTNNLNEQKEKLRDLKEMQAGINKILEH